MEETRNIPPAGDPFAVVVDCAGDLSEIPPVVVVEEDDPNQLTIYDVPGVGQDPVDLLRANVREFLLDCDRRDDEGNVLIEPTEEEMRAAVNDPNVIELVSRYYLRGDTPEAQAERLADEVWDCLGDVQSGSVLAVLEDREQLRAVTSYDGSEEAERARLEAVEDMRLMSRVLE